MPSADFRCDVCGRIARDLPLREKQYWCCADKDFCDGELERIYSRIGIARVDNAGGSPARGSNDKR